VAVAVIFMTLRKRENWSRNIIGNRRKKEMEIKKVKRIIRDLAMDYCKSSRKFLDLTGNEEKALRSLIRQAIWNGIALEREGISKAPTKEKANGN
jgi:hypothetical protein